MTDRLLGTSPDQITESEKEERYKGIVSRKQAICQEKPQGWTDRINELTAEEVQLDEKYPELPPDEPICVIEIDQTCVACPSQWEGKTVDGKEVYVRYRWGYLRVEIDEKHFFGKRLDYGESEEEILRRTQEAWGDENTEKSLESYRMIKAFSGGVFSYDGTLSYEELIEATKNWLTWP